MLQKVTKRSSKVIVTLSVNFLSLFGKKISNVESLFNPFTAAWRNGHVITETALSQELLEPAQKFTEINDREMKYLPGKKIWAW